MAIAWSSVQAYARNPVSGDRPGFVFVTIFLIFWCLPMTAVLLQLGAEGVVSRASEHRRRMMLKIAETSLVSGAGFFLAYGLWLAALSLGPSRMPVFELYFDSALILLFSANAYACALRVRSATGTAPEGGSGWMTGILLAATALVTSHTIAIGSMGVEGGVLAFAAPAAVWVMVLAWSARRWRQTRAATIPAERGNRSDLI